MGKGEIVLKLSAQPSGGSEMEVTGHMRILSKEIAKGKGEIFQSPVIKNAPKVVVE